MSTKAQIAPAEQLLTDRKSLARRYGISVRQVDEWIATKRFPIVRLGRRCVRIPIASADEYVNRFTVEGATR